VHEAAPLPVKADDWLTTRRYAALLALFVFASWPQVFLGLQTFGYRDFGYYAYPIAFQLRESFLHGEIPLWSHLSYCGVPFLAQWNTQVLYPLNLFYVLLPLSWSLAVFCLLHLYLAGLGMFLLARRWTGGAVPAAVAGVAFAFSGLMINCLMWPGTIPGMAWMPWLVWLAERAWREGGRWTVAAALVGALQMLSGAAEPVMLTWVLLGTLWLAEYAANKTLREKLFLRGGTLVLLVAALSAAQLLPFLDLLNHSQRQVVFDAALWPMPPTGWANFLMPLFGTQRSLDGVFMQPNQQWTYSYYVGGLTAVLAAWAAWRVRERRVWLLAGLTLLCLVLALGDATPLYRWCRVHVVFVKLMRFPVKFVILPVFALPLLAAFALAQKGDFARRKKEWTAIGFAVVTTMMVLVWFTIKQARPDNDWMRIIENTAARGLLFTAILGLWFCAETISAAPRRNLLQLLILALMWVDVADHAPQPQTVHPAIYKPGWPRVPPAPGAGEGRAMVSHEAVLKFAQQFSPKTGLDYLGRRQALFSNCNLLDDVAKVDGFFPLQLRIGREIQLLFYNSDAPNPPPAPLLDFLGASQITAPGDLYAWTYRTNCLPLVTGGQKPIFTTDTNIVHAIASGNFNPRAEVYISPEQTIAPAVDNGAPVEVSDIYFTAQRVTARVDAAAAGWVVIAQTYYNPWHAYVDGQPVHLWRANYAFQAVEVPAGAHGLALVYEDRRFFGGTIISLAALLVCGAAFVFLPKRR
jgi:hypothetical protein